MCVLQVYRLLYESRQDPISHQEAKETYIRITKDIIIADKVSGALLARGAHCVTAANASHRCLLARVAGRRCHS